MKSILDRRTFLQLCSACAAFLTPAIHAQTKPAPPLGRGPVKFRKNYAGIKVRAFAWVDEGIDPVLDNMQHKGGVNTVWAYTFAYGEQRLKKGSTLPDHGVPLAPGSSEQAGGAFYDYDPKFFQDTFLKQFRAANYGKFNVIEQVAPKVKARGMDFIAWDLNNPSPTLDRAIPNYVEVAEVDAYGRRTGNPCFNHPDYQAFLTGKVQSVLSGYADLVDGYAWGSERMGPMNNLIAGSNSATCFCRFCQARAREQGISVARAQAGYRQLGELFDATSKDPAPIDGYFVVFWRLLLKYPEILSWESLWIDSYHEVEAQLYGTAKAIAPQKPFGFHIMQSQTFSPFFRAEENYAERREYADFLKLCTYNNAGGPRMAAYVKSLGRTVFRDAPPSDFLPLYYKMMNYQEASYDKLPTAGLTPDYVAKETKRAVAGVGGAAKIYSGIDIDVPSLEDTSSTGAKPTRPEDVRRSIHAAYDAGADGVVLSRDYVEMWLSNLSAAGDALKEIFAQPAKQS